MHLHSSLLVAYLALLVGLGFGLLAVHAPRPVLMRLGVLLALVFAQGLRRAPCSSSPGCPPRWWPCTSPARPRAPRPPRRYGPRCESGPSPSRSRADSTPSANSRWAEVARGRRRAAASPATAHEIEFQQVGIAGAADRRRRGRKAARRRRCPARSAAACERGMPDVPQFEVGVDRRLRAVKGVGLRRRRQEDQRRVGRSHGRARCSGIGTPARAAGPPGSADRHSRPRRRAVEQVGHRSGPGQEFARRSARASPVARRITRSARSVAGSSQDSQRACRPRCAARRPARRRRRPLVSAGQPASTIRGWRMSGRASFMQHHVG